MIQNKKTVWERAMELFRGINEVVPDKELTITKCSVCGKKIEYSNHLDMCFHHRIIRSFYHNYQQHYQMINEGKK